jgi:hypothetical protein
MAAEGRHLEFLGFGHREGFESIQRLMMGYAQENLDKVAQALAVCALSGEPAPLAPHSTEAEIQEDSESEGPGGETAGTNMNRCKGDGQ